MIKPNHTHDFECSKCVGFSGWRGGNPWAFEMECMINGDTWTSFLKEPPDYQEFKEKEKEEWKEWMQRMRKGIKALKRDSEMR